ncbi:class I SAM-dependent methyltransferase [Sphingomonas sp. 1P06PA]|uniref:class I SAM-dependent methyltransferase n=1 Tax=Sphingomonas sp. 1P06PA TaxID=554121 RepID=UPI0039A5AC54
MALIPTVRARLQREKFLTTRLSLPIHPFYIIRSRLHRAIAPRAASLSGSVLDFGCGSKPYETLFANAHSYVGVDIAASGHSHVRSRIDHFYDGETLPFDDASFDAVVSFEVFEHVFNLDRILAEIRRVLKPGGRLLFSIPFAWDEHEQPYDFGRYTSFGIAALLERHGFGVREIVKASTDVEAIVQLFAAYLHQHLAPRWMPLRLIFQLLLIAPVTLVGLILSRLLPASGQLYTNLVVLAEPAA